MLLNRMGPGHPGQMILAGHTTDLLEVFAVSRNNQAQMDACCNWQVLSALFRCLRFWTWTQKMRAVDLL